MHKSIPLLKDLTLHQRPQSILALSSPHPTELVLQKQSSILSSLTQKSQSSFPPRHVGSTWLPCPLSQNGSSKEGGQLENRGQGLCPNPGGNLPLPTAAVPGAAARARGSAQRTAVQNNNVNAHKQAHAYEGHV